MEIEIPQNKCPDCSGCGQFYSQLDETINCERCHGSGKWYNEAEQEQLLALVMNTVGAAESDNIKEFIKGAKIAIAKCSYEYGKMIQEQWSVIRSTTRLSDERFKELKTISNILSSYSD